MLGGPWHRKGENFHSPSDGPALTECASLELLTIEVKSLGATILTGKTVSQLLREDGQTKGVVCTDGSTYEAALVVLATGAWTGSSFDADLDCNALCTATG